MWARIRSFWSRHKDRYVEALQRYGLAVWLTAVLMRVLMATAVTALVKLGWSFESLSTDTGLFVAAWVFVWPLAPIRWILAAIIAPPIVRAFRRWRGQDPDLPPVLPDEPSP
jgi:hypothetical protein